MTMSEQDQSVCVADQPGPQRIAARERIWMGWAAAEHPAAVVEASLRACLVFALRRRMLRLKVSHT